MTNQSEITLVNLFTVKSEKQQSAANKIAEIYRMVVSLQPGFISAKIHTSLDGTKVAAITYGRLLRRQRLRQRQRSLEL
jgi:tRNA U54 and U55 pseudouridine synthase Pus10